MPQFLHLPPVAQGVMAISAVALAIVRLLTASRPFWAWEKVPVWVQKLLPALLMAVAALPTAIEHARSWLDIVVGLVVTGSMWFTASRGDKRPPVDKDGGPRQERVNTDPNGPVSLMPDPVREVAQDRSRLHNDAPDEPAELSKWRAPDWRLSLVFGVLLASALPAACSSVPLTSKRCDFQNPEYTAHVAMCRQEIAETCLLNEDGTPRPDCPALVKCEAWRKEQCQ